MVIEGMFSFGPEDNGVGGKRRFGGIGGEINYILGKIISILGGKCLHFGEKNYLIRVENLRLEGGRSLQSGGEKDRSTLSALSGHSCSHCQLPPLLTIPSPLTGISCPAHSHYELCALDCSRTCSSIFAPLRCTERCREGCVCDEGFVFSGDECVPMARCGCLHHGSYYKVEEHFRPTKLEECECHADGMVDCHKIPAPTESSCQGVGEGHQCPTATSGTCVVTGDRSYLSFDGTAFDIPGACAYVLTESCSGDDDTEHFVVKIKKNSRQKTKVSGIEVLSVEVYGLTLTMERGKIGTVMVRWHLVGAKLGTRHQLCHRGRGDTSPYGSASCSAFSCLMSKSMGS